MTRTKLDIFSYTDFRRFLADRIEELHEDSSKYSQRYLCRRVGLANNNYLRMIIDGKRNLTDPVARKLAKEMGLNKAESAFFFEMIRYGQSRTIEAKTEALEVMRHNRKFSTVQKLSLEHFDYMTNPLTLAIREMVNYDDFEEDPRWIGRQLTFKASSRQIREAIEKLLGLGLLQRDDSGRLKATFQHTVTGDVLGSTPLRVYHSRMLESALKAIELPPDQRYLRGLTMSVPRSAYGKIVEMYSEFVDQVRGVINEAVAPDHVYHMELALFPLARRVTPLPDDEGPEKGGK